MATRNSGTPGPGGYWLPWPASTASAAAWATAGGPSTSGKPWPRLTEPVRTASADISAKIVVPMPVRRWLSSGLRTAPMTSCPDTPGGRVGAGRVDAGRVSLGWEHASRALPDPGQLPADGQPGPGPRGPGRGGCPAGRPGRFPGGDPDPVRLRPAAGGGAAVRPVRLIAGRGGRGRGGGAGRGDLH